MGPFYTYLVIWRMSHLTRTDVTIKFQSDVAPGRPWGAWTTIGWVVAAMAPQLLLLLWIMHSPSRPGIGPVLVFLLWAISPAVLIISVLIRRLSIASYMAWTVPRPSDLTVAVGAALIYCLGYCALAYLVSGGRSIGLNSDAYRHYLAAGGAPSRYLLKYYQAYLYAPIVEETVFRGFLWRGVAASRLGNWGAWLVSSALFVASHTIDYADPVALIPVGISGLIFGLVRWRTGSTTACMITHSLYNLWGDAGAMLSFAAGWP